MNLAGHDFVVDLANVIEPDGTKTGPFILNYGTVIIAHPGSQGQSYIYDSELPVKPAVPAGRKPVLSRLLGMKAGDQTGLLFHRLNSRENGSDCGLFAIAFAAAIITESEVDTAGLNSKKLRSHSPECCQTLKLRPFPGARSRVHRQPVVSTLKGLNPAGCRQTMRAILFLCG